MYQDLIRDTEIYQLIMQDGIQQQEKREIQELRQNILHAFQIRFPELSSLAIERISPIADLATLNKLTLDIMITESIDQAHSILNSLNQTEQH